MEQLNRENRSYRGLLQSDDGVIAKVTQSSKQKITFQSEFGLSKNMIQRLKRQPEHIVFSERSRIARLGFQIASEPPAIKDLKNDLLTLTQVVSPVIPGYPDLNQIQEFFIQFSSCKKFANR